MQLVLNKISVVLVLILVGFTLANCQNVEEKAAIDFSKIKSQEIKTAFETAKAYQKLVLLVFDAKWCPYCKQLNEKTFQDEKVLKTLEGFEKLNVDIDDYPEDADFFNGKPASRGGNGIPTIIILNADGVELDRAVGFHEAKDFNTFLKKTLKKQKEL